MEPLAKKRKVQARSSRRSIQVDALAPFLIPDLANLVLDYVGTGIDGQNHEVLLEKCTKKPDFLISVQPGQLLTVSQVWDCRLVDYNYSSKSAHESENLGLDIHHYAIHATAEHFVFLNRKGVLVVRGIHDDFFWSSPVLPDTMEMLYRLPCLTSSKNQVFVFSGDGCIQVWGKTSEGLTSKGTIHIPGPISHFGTRMVVDGSELFLLMSGRSDLHVFDINQMVHLRTFRVPLFSADFCVAGNELFLIHGMKLPTFTVLDRETGEFLREWSCPRTENHRSPRSICYDGYSILVGMASLHNLEGHIERVF